MNKVTRDIMKLIGCDPERALMIQMAMDIDFSECTQKQFEREVRIVASIVKDVEKDVVVV